MNKKGAELSMDVIIIAAIVLLVLVVLSIIFLGRIGIFNPTNETNQTEKASVNFTIHNSTPSLAMHSINETDVRIIINKENCHPVICPCAEDGCLLYCFECKGQLISGVTNYHEVYVIDK